MKRYLVVLAAACALLLALAASPAFAGGGLLPSGGSQEQSVTNATDQSNQAEAVNVPILSGNNVAVLSGGDQSNSAGTSQNQVNVNGTSQQADQSQTADPSQEQSTSNSTDQQNQAEAVNVPIASGNNVAILSGGDQSNSAGVEQNQANVNGTSQQADQGQSADPSNSTDQQNQAEAVNVPIASGNNVAVLSGGDQSNSAGVEQNQANVNGTSQQADQADSSSGPSKGCPHETQSQSTSNETKQENNAEAINVPIASGNNVAVLSWGKQSNSAGVEQNQINANATKQDASQSGSSNSYEKSGREQSVRNSTHQENNAEAVNVPIASGNNLAVLSWGTQSNSAGVEQNQANLDVTKQEASQDGWGSQNQSVRNSTRQENEAWALNVPILSGNNLAILSKGRQYNSAGVEQNQANINYTKQEASQTGSSSHTYEKTVSRCDTGRTSGSVRNSTRQENEAWALNAPVLSGNNVAFLSWGRQSNSAGVEQNQANVNVTKQEVCEQAS